jgi:glycosyltransferase involved in cell wall biosynthesis
MDNMTPTIPKISVVMPLYNKGKEVSRAIDSVLSQTVKKFELIVVNDGSTDKGPEVVRGFEDQRIRIIDQQNAGVSAARNRGIADATTGLVAFLDADDEWAGDYLEIILRLVDKFPGASVFATGYTFKRVGGQERRAIIRGLPESFSEGILENYFDVAGRSDPPLCSSAVAVRKEAIESVGGFPLGISAGEDLLTWARLAVGFTIAYSTKSRAVFWEPVARSAQPRREPQDPDIVGCELEKLLEYAGTNKASLTKYIALWHKMRANIFMRLRARKQAFKEIGRAIQLSGINLNLVALAFLSALPGKSGLTLYSLLKSIGQQSRYK